MEGVGLEDGAEVEWPVEGEDADAAMGGVRVGEVGILPEHRELLVAEIENAFFVPAGIEDFEGELAYQEPAIGSAVEEFQQGPGEMLAGEGQEAFKGMVSMGLQAVVEAWVAGCCLGEGDRMEAKIVLGLLQERFPLGGVCQDDGHSLLAAFREAPWMPEVAHGEVSLAWQPGEGAVMAGVAKQQGVCEAGIEGGAFQGEAEHLPCFLLLSEEGVGTFPGA